MVSYRKIQLAAGGLPLFAERDSPFSAVKKGVDRYLMLSGKLPRSVVSSGGYENFCQVGYPFAAKVPEETNRCSYPRFA